MVPEQNLVVWKLAITVLHVFAIVTTVIRVIQRRFSNGMWWDDYLAIIPAIMTVVQIIVVYALFIPGGVTDQSRRVSLYWTLALSWFTLIWFCRISLALSIARIFPAWATPRRFAMGLTVCFGIIFVSTISWQATLTCGGSVDPDKFLSCDEERYRLTLFSVICDVIADVFLIASPCYMLWRIRLPKNQRRLVLTLFSSSALTLLSAILFIVCTYSPWVYGPGAKTVTQMAAQIEGCVSLIVCNLVVCVTFFLRMFRKDHQDPEAIIDDKVTRHIPPISARRVAPMSIAVLTLTETARPVSGAPAKFELTDKIDDSDATSTDVDMWPRKSDGTFNVKLPRKDTQSIHSI